MDGYPQRVKTRHKQQCQNLRSTRQPHKLISQAENVIYTDYQVVIWDLYRNLVDFGYFWPFAPNPAFDSVK